ncbi:hypothetical protein PG991_008882 [Apiospora marii]|uniref:Transposase n=1 Tax=Apiospora marii TaxID=335849 RepID=A0ABR1RN86_9PEZI
MPDRTVFQTGSPAAPVRPIPKGAQQTRIGYQILRVSIRLPNLLRGWITLKRDWNMTGLGSFVTGVEAMAAP